MPVWVSVWVSSALNIPNDLLLPHILDKDESVNNRVWRVAYSTVLHSTVFAQQLVTRNIYLQKLGICICQGYFALFHKIYNTINYLLLVFTIHMF